jgi:hypothetical protein
VNVKRERVQSPSGHEFVVATSPSGGLYTDDIYTSPLFFRARHLGMLLDLIGWVRHRFWRHGRWTVAAAKVGANGKPTELSYSAFASDRNAAREAVAALKRRIRDGQLG